jgi:hypothetical protein
VDDFSLPSAPGEDVGWRFFTIRRLGRKRFDRMGEGGYFKVSNQLLTYLRVSWQLMASIFLRMNGAA